MHCHPCIINFTNTPLPFLPSYIQHIKATNESTIQKIIEQTESKLIFCLIDSSTNISELQKIKATQHITVITVAFCENKKDAIQLTADFVAQSQLELEQLFCFSPKHSISIVIIAFNEQEAILNAISDARILGQTYLKDYEIIVVNDGSTDNTLNVLNEHSSEDVIVVNHPTNLGMGAAMKSGYLTATKDFIFMLPADRQVRPNAILHFLPHLEKHTSVLSFYQKRPFGWKREVISNGFRFLIKYVGGIHINFTGIYGFHRTWIKEIDISKIPAKSFLFSFEFLEQMKRKGCQFKTVTIHNFSRQSGQSRVFNLKKITSISMELVQNRISRLL